MTDKDIREAKDILNRGHFHANDKGEEAVITLIRLAEQYLAIERFPKERELDIIIDEFEEVHNTPISYGNEQYNQARQECILALMKKIDGIEEVISREINSNTSILNLSRAIKTYILEEK